MSKDNGVCVFCELPKEADKDLCNACIADDEVFYKRMEATKSHNSANKIGN
jgi:hypothetical protein